jgi:hypothetical protein
VSRSAQFGLGRPGIEDSLLNALNQVTESTQAIHVEIVKVFQTGYVWSC